MVSDLTPHSTYSNSDGEKTSHLNIQMITEQHENYRNDYICEPLNSNLEQTKAKVSF